MLAFYLKNYRLPRRNPNNPSAKLTPFVVLVFQMFKENKSNRVVFQQCDYHTSSCRVHDIKSFMLIDLNYFFLARENILARQIPLQAKHNDDIIDKKS